MKKQLLTGLVYLISLVSLAQSIPEYNERKYEKKAKKLELTNKITGKQNKDPYMLFLEDNNFRLEPGSIYFSMNKVNTLSRETDKGFEYLQRIPGTEFFVSYQASISSVANMGALDLSNKLRNLTPEELKKLDKDKKNRIIEYQELTNYLK